MERVVFDDETGSKSGDILTKNFSVARTKGDKSNEMKKLRDKAARASDESDEAQASTLSGVFMIVTNDAIDIDQGDWILYSGASRHLVNNESLLIDSSACVHEIDMTDGKSLWLTRVGNVRLAVLARDMKMNVTLTEVFLAPHLAKNIVSY